MRRIQGETEPPLKLSQLTPEERLEVMNVHVRGLRPLLRYMPVERLKEVQNIDPPTIHTPIYGEGLDGDTRALTVYGLLRDDRASLFGRRTMTGRWLALTIKGVWIYWDAEGHGSEEVGFTTTSSFSLVPHRELLGMLQGEIGARIVRGVIEDLLRYAVNIARSREQRAVETRRILESSRGLTEDVVNLFA